MKDYDDLLDEYNLVKSWLIFERKKTMFLQEQIDFLNVENDRLRKERMNEVYWT